MKISSMEKMIEFLRRVFPNAKVLKEPEKFPLLKHPNKALTMKCEEYSEDEVVDVEFIQALKKGLVKYNAISLSANQFGVFKRVMVYAPTPDENYIVICMNPKIIGRGENVNWAQEGSVSAPGVGVNVARFDTIEVEYHGLGLGKITRKIRGWEARIFQHEMDQLDGEFIPKLIDQRKKIKSGKVK